MKLHRILLYCAALSFGAGTSVARAQGGPPQTQLVHLQDGSIYQGELVEFVPNDHLTLRLASGEIKRFAWSDMQPLSMPIAPSATVPQAVVVPGIVAPIVISPPPPPEPPEPSDPVQLHFEASDPAAVLYARRAGGPRARLLRLLDDQDWQMVCPRGPCDVVADRRQLYSVRGPSIVHSQPFTLPLGNQVNAMANVTHDSMHSFLSGMLVLGSLGIAAGIGLFIAGGAQDTSGAGLPSGQQMQAEIDGQNRQHNLYVAGGAVAGASIAIIVAASIAYKFARTTVNFTADGHVALRRSGSGKSSLDLYAMQVRF